MRLAYGFLNMSTPVPLYLCLYASASIPVSQCLCICRSFHRCSSIPLCISCLLCRGNQCVSVESIFFLTSVTRSSTSIKHAIYSLVGSFLRSFLHSFPSPHLPSFLPSDLTPSLLTSFLLYPFFLAFPPSILSLLPSYSPSFLPSFHLNGSFFVLPSFILPPSVPPSIT